MLLGGFVLGALGLLAGGPRTVLAERALTDSYAGGMLVLALVAIEAAVRYFV